MFFKKVFSHFLTAKLLYRKEAGNSFNLTVMVVVGQHYFAGNSALLLSDVIMPGIFDMFMLICAI